MIRSPLLEGTWALLESIGYQNHAPILCWLDNERLGCVWMGGIQEGTHGMSIYMSELRAGKRNWSRPRMISQDKQRSEQNPLLFVSSDTRLHLIHTAQRVRDINDESWQESGSAFSMQWTACLRHQSRSLKSGKWSMASDLVNQPGFCRHPPYMRTDGCWLLPIYRSLEAGGEFGHDHSQVLLLDEEGKPTKDLIDVPESIGRVHGSIVASADGTHLLQFFRSRLADRIYRSIGSIDGTDWSEPQPINLPNNNSSIQACRLRSGKLAIIFNRFCLEEEPQSSMAWGSAKWPRTRWPLSIALSDDDGDTWPWIRDIDSGLGFCGSENWMRNGQLAYPSLIEGLPGELHIAYSWGGRIAIRYICLEESSITGIRTWPW